MTTPYLLRTLTRSRGVSAASVAMLALGIGALTSTFALGDAAIYRPPPFADAARLATLYITHVGADGVANRTRWSYPRIQLLRARVTSFETVANFSGTTLTLTGDGGAESLAGEIVGPTYFRVLRAQPVMGRFFAADEDDAAGAHPLVVISPLLWQRRFQGRSDVIGKRLVLNGTPFTIIGVTPENFDGVSGRAQYWIPTTMAPSTSYAEYLTTNQNFISVIGRLKTGVTLTQANAELAILGVAINAQIPSGSGVPGKVMRASAMSLNEARIDVTTKRSVLTLLGGVILLYLLACANVANLLLTRAVSRRRESAVRAALGCSRTRLIWRNVGETAVLTMAGGALGLLIAYWVSTMVTVPSVLWSSRNFYGAVGAFDHPEFNARVVLFGVSLVALTTLLVSWAPAVSLTNFALLPALRAGSRSVADKAGTLRRPTVRGVVVAFEAALAVLLLVAGGLMITSFDRMRHTPLGVDADHVLTFLLRPSDVHVPVALAPAFIDRMLAAITSVPGVISASVDGGAPSSGSASSVLHIVGQPFVPDNRAPDINRHYIAPDHFRTLGMRVLSGRAFTDADREGRAKVTIISESAARRFFPGENPLGKRVWFASSGTWANADSSAEIVGIVNDVVHEPLDAEPNRNEFYTPYKQFTYSWRNYFVKTADDPLSAVPRIREALLAAAPDVPLTEVKSLRELIGQSWARHRFDAWLFGGFAAVALLLASVGIYSVVAYAVAQRTREMGIRLALGAQPASIIRLVLREGMVFPAVGLAVGVVLSLATTRVLQASLYEITPTDPAVFAVTVSVLLAVAAFACIAPARRATHVDPTEALRAD